MIIPNTILVNRYFEKIRRQLIFESALKSIVSFEIMPFEDTSVEVVIISAQNSSNNNGYASIIRVNTEQEMKTIYNISTQNFVAFPRLEFRISWTPEELETWKRINAVSNPLYKDNTLYNGIKTSDNSEMIDVQPHGRFWKPVIRGSDVSQYFIAPHIGYVNFDKKLLKSGVVATNRT